MNDPDQENFDPIAAKFADTATVNKLMRQAGHEAVAKARCLGLLDAPTPQQLRAALLEKIKQLDIAEQIELIEAAWDNLTAQTSEVALTEAQKTELDRRLDRHRARKT